MSKKNTAATQPAVAAATKTPQTQGHVAIKTGTGIAKGACIDGYISGLGQTASGKPTLDIADAVADRLRGLTADAVAVLARAEITRITGSDPGDLAAKYAHLNPGQVRMNCGNRLRAALKADAGR